MFPASAFAIEAWSESPSPRTRRSATLAGDGAPAGYYLFPSVRGDLLMKMGRTAEARGEIARAKVLLHGDPPGDGKRYVVRTIRSDQFGIVKRVYVLDLSLYNLNPIEHMINAIYCLHVEDSRNVVSLDNVLLHVDAFDQRQDTCQETLNGLPAAQYSN